MAIFNSFLYVYQRVYLCRLHTIVLNITSREKKSILAMRASCLGIASPPIAQVAHGDLGCHADFFLAGKKIVSINGLDSGKIGTGNIGNQSTIVSA